MDKFYSTPDGVNGELIRELIQAFCLGILIPQKINYQSSIGDVKFSKIFRVHSHFFAPVSVFSTEICRKELRSTVPNRNK